jgi:hypothetical protein
MQHWKIWMMIMWKSVGLGNIMENIKTSAKEFVGHYELKQHDPWFDKNAKNY